MGCLKLGCLGGEAGMSEVGMFGGGEAGMFEGETWMFFWGGEEAGMFEGNLGYLGEAGMFWGGNLNV